VIRFDQLDEVFQYPPEHDDPTTLIDDPDPDPPS
jgi:hypothetical protein